MTAAEKRLAGFLKIAQVHDVLPAQPGEQMEELSASIRNASLEDLADIRVVFWIQRRSRDLDTARARKLGSRTIRTLLRKRTEVVRLTGVRLPDDLRRGAHYLIVQIESFRTGRKVLTPKTEKAKSYFVR